MMNTSDISEHIDKSGSKSSSPSTPLSADEATTMGVRHAASIDSSQQFLAFADRMVLHANTLSQNEILLAHDYGCKALILVVAKALKEYKVEEAADLFVHLERKRSVIPNLVSLALLLVHLPAEYWVVLQHTVNFNNILTKPMPLLKDFDLSKPHDESINTADELQRVQDLVRALCVFSEPSRDKNHGLEAFIKLIIGTMKHLPLSSPTWTYLAFWQSSERISELFNLSHSPHVARIYQKFCSWGLSLLVHESGQTLDIKTYVIWLEYLEEHMLLREQMVKAMTFDSDGINSIDAQLKLLNDAQIQTFISSLPPNTQFRLAKVWPQMDSERIVALTIKIPIGRLLESAKGQQTAPETISVSHGTPGSCQDIPPSTNTKDGSQQAKTHTSQFGYFASSSQPKLEPKPCGPGPSHNPTQESKSPKR